MLLSGALDRLVEPGRRGDPGSPLRWTCRSTRVLAREGTRKRQAISHTTVAEWLAAQGYCLQGNRRSAEGIDHPEREAQFRHICKEVRRALAHGTPVISIDTKKKELVGNHAFLLAPPLAWDPLRPRIRDQTIRVFERSGHWPQYEETELFDRHLLEWMHGQGTTG